MLTNGKIKQTTFGGNGVPLRVAAAQLASAIHAADVEKANNLRKTRPMREANARRRAQREGA